MTAADERLLLDELARSSWPVGAEERSGGWLLRHTLEVTRRRSNSALPAHDVAAADLLAGVGAVTRYYRERRLTPMVQLSPLELRGELDELLATHHWRAHAPTAVLVADAMAVAAAAGEQATGPTVTLQERIDGAWVAAWARCEARPHAAAEHRRVLSRIAAPLCAATAHLDGRPAGVALGVCEQGWTSVLCVATDARVRRRGVARALLGVLASWSTRRGADGLHLAVETCNPPARALYASLGFSASHTYHYRRAPSETA